MLYARFILEEFLLKLIVILWYFWNFGIFFIILPLIFVSWFPLRLGFAVFSHPGRMGAARGSIVRGKIMNSGASMDAMTLSMHRCYVTSLEDTRVLYLILCRRHCYWLCETSIIDHFLWVICMYMIWHVLSYLDISLHMPGFSYIVGCHWPSAVYSY